MGYELLHGIQKGKKMSVTEAIKIKLNCLYEKDGMKSDLYTPCHVPVVSFPSVIGEANEWHNKLVRDQHSKQRILMSAFLLDFPTVFLLFFLNVHIALFLYNILVLY